MWLSEDGFTWTRVPYDESVFGGDVMAMTGVADNGTRLVAVGTIRGPLGPGGADCPDYSGSAVWISDDQGHTWVRVPHDPAVFGGEEEDNHRMFAVFVNDDGFVALGDDLWTSPDGWSWTRLGPFPRSPASCPH